jgi:hypothetical protein
MENWFENTIKKNLKQAEQLDLGLKGTNRSLSSRRPSLDRASLVVHRDRTVRTAS